MTAISKQAEILYIEDNGDLLRVTRKFLAMKGYAVTTAETLAAGRESLAENPPDVILLDNHLPDGNGFDLLREIRAKHSVPVLFLSGEREDELPALKAGANDFLRRPCDYDVMIARLNVMLNGIGHSRDAPESDAVKTPDGQAARPANPQP